ncbi:MAG: DNA methyltransferase [Synergistaceae bacterium]
MDVVEDVRENEGDLAEINWTLQQFNIDELTDYYKNPRSLSDKEFKQLKTSLDKFGMIDKPIVNADSLHTIIGGHQRKHVLEASGVTEIECWIPDRELSDKEVEELNIRLNKNTGQWDFDVLANEFQLDDLLDWGFDKGELDLDLWADDAPEDVEPQIDKAEELREKWGVETGQLWQLGEHRLVCGDCTDKAVVDKVMQGEVAGAVVTDPPYGINREGIENDDPEGLQALFDGCLAVMPIENAVVIAFQSPRLFPVWLDAIRDRGQEFGRALWLYRTGQNAFPWHGWYMRGDCIIVSVAGHPTWADWPQAVSDCYEVNINDHETVKATAVGGISGHSTIKPFDVVSNLVEHTTGIVYEPFSGSGTTLIACERLGRKCRAVEISPAYVAVAIQRWVDVTGGEPVLLTL